MRRGIARGGGERYRGNGVHLQDTEFRGNLHLPDKEERDLMKDGTLPPTDKALRDAGPHRLRGDSLLSTGSDLRSL